MILLLILLLPLGDSTTGNHSFIKQRWPEKPKVCLTFDDGNPADMPGYGWQEWNALLLQHLQASRVQAIFFAYGQAVDNSAGKRILAQWSQAGSKSRLEGQSVRKRTAVCPLLSQVRK